jgi:rhodanese-related sulfurtransferase
MPALQRRRTADDLLAEARSQLVRVSARQAAAEIAAGKAILIDIRGDYQRELDGLIPGADVVARNVLEWRLDPACAHRDERLTASDARVILICDEGYQSSLAAANLRRIGVDATDLEGGFKSWRAAGLPVSAKD